MLVRGPFNITWGVDELVDIEEVDIEYEQDTEDYQTVQGRTLEIDGSKKIAVTLTLLDSDVAALGVILPQHFVAQGETLSTGEEVLSEDGAIDIVPRACGEDIITRDLEIVSCGNPSDILRVNSARSKLDGIELDDKVRKVMVRLVGEAPSGEAVVQFFKDGGIESIS